MAFHKVSRVELLATLNTDQSWTRRTAVSVSAISHFAQKDIASLKAILEAVAGKYLISKDPNDYIFVALRAVTEEVPNGNGDAFPRSELLSWNQIEEKPVYRTFEFKPHQVNHKAADPRMARGVVIDSHYNESDPDDRFVEILVAVDTKKDPILARGLLDGTLDSFSMGCSAMRTVCNVCGNVARSPKDYCNHIRSGKLKLHKIASGEEKLGFEWCYEVTFDEISSVDDPADKTALTQEILKPQEMPLIENDTNVLELRARVRRIETQLSHEVGLPRAAAQQRGVHSSMNIEAKKKTPVVDPKGSEHTALADVYAKYHDKHFGNVKSAMEDAVKESGKNPDDIKQAWHHKMMSDIPHPEAKKIVHSFAAQMEACGDYKKAVKRCAKDHEIDQDLVEKCAEWMKSCHKMEGFEMEPKMQAAEEEIPNPKDGVPASAQAEKVPDPKGGVPASASSEEIPPPPGGVPASAEKHKPSSEDAAKPKAAAAEEIPSPGQIKTQNPPGPGPSVLAEKGAQAEEVPDPKGGIPACASAEMPPKKDEPKEASAEKPADKPKEDEAKKAQDEMEAKKKAQKKEEDDAKKAAEGAAPGAPEHDAQSIDQQQAISSKEKSEEKTPGEMGVKSAAVQKNFPYAKSYADCNASRTASGEVRVFRGKELVFSIPVTAGKTAAQQIKPTDVLKSVARIGMLATIKSFGGVTAKAASISKKADQGVGEGAISDVEGGRPLPPGSVTDGAVLDGRETHKVNPDSATARGETADHELHRDKKNLGNSDVRQETQSNWQGGYDKSKDTVVTPQVSDSREKHPQKNVGQDDVLKERQVDFVTAGLDPKSASLIRDRLAKIAQELKDEHDKEKDKKAAEDKVKEDEAKKAQDKSKEDAEKAAKSVEDGEKAVNEKVEKACQARMANFMRKFERGVKLAAKRIALNLEPSDLKYNLGEVLCTRHEASGYTGMPADLCIDILERGFNTNAAMENTVNQMVKRASEFVAMSDEAFAAIEKDAQNISPIHPTTQATPVVPTSDLGRRAAAGSLPVLKTAAETPNPVPTLQQAVRAAVGSPLTRKYGVGR